MFDGAAQDIWSEVNSKFIPLLEQRIRLISSRADLTANMTETSASMSRLSEHFTQHHAEILALQDKVNAELGDFVLTANDRSHLVMALSLLIVAISVGVLLVMMRAGKLAISNPVQALTESARRLSARDYDAPIPHAGNANEIGQMASALVDLRDVGKQAQMLEAQVAEHNRAAAAEAARAAQEQEQAAAAFNQTLSRFVDGDLTAQVEDDVSAAYATIKRDLNTGLERLRGALASIKTGTDNIRGMTHEIATAAEDLSRRTESQAANLEETAAAVEEITATVKSAADNATNARQVVSGTKLEAEKSGEVVARAVEAMSAIEGSSRQISQIIGVIDEIAFQTNLLALNAGVEAARAGEAGRGFAVVATEVRALAQRSAEAARQIKDLISASTSQVDQGVGLVAETGKALERIVAAVGEINDLVAEIASGAVEQSTGLAQVNVAVVQLDQITQQNAAMVEETTAAVRALADQSETVAEELSRFRTGFTGQEGAELIRLEGQSREAAAPTREGTGGSAHQARTRRSQPLLRVAGGAPRPVSDEGWSEF